MQYIANSEPIEVFSIATGEKKDVILSDNIIISIKFSDGSIATINYNSEGDVSFPRERLEVFCDNSIGIIDNFTKSIFTRAGISKKFNKLSRDMGHGNEVREIISAISNNKSSPIQFYEIITTTLATFKILESLQKSQPVKIDTKQWLRQNNLNF